jgi:ribokinase
VNTDHVKVTPRTASGVAMILVDQRGENSIVVAPGANAKLTPADVDGAWDVIRRASIVMLQLEIRLKTVRHAVALCRKLNVKTILDPAPMPEKGLPRDLLAVDILTPNETEGRNLHGHSRNMVLKMGSKGSQWVTPDKIFRAKPFRVRVIDTTAAGDAFTGALGVAMAEGMSIEDCLNFANAAGALCCTKLGAQPALPSRREVSLKLRERTK